MPGIKRTVEVAKEKLNSLIDDHLAGFEKALAQRAGSRLCVDLKIKIDLDSEEGPNTLATAIAYTTERVNETLRCQVDEDQGELFDGPGEED